MSLTIHPKTLICVSVVALVISILLCVVSLCIVVPLLSPTPDNPQQESEPEEKTGPSWKYDYYDLKGNYEARLDPSFTINITRDGQCTLSYMGMSDTVQLDRQNWGDSKSNLYYDDGEFLGSVELIFGGTSLILDLVYPDVEGGMLAIQFYRVYE